MTNYTNELVKAHLNTLDKRIEQLEDYLLQGPSTHETSDAVSMEYMHRVGQLSEAKELRELFKVTVQTYFG